MSEPSKSARSRDARATLIPVTLKLSPEDRDALQREALRRRLDGVAKRIDMSAIVRALIAEWRNAGPAKGGLAVPVPTEARS
jgi:hypothetical protein